MAAAREFIRQARPRWSRATTGEIPDALAALLTSAQTNCEVILPSGRRMMFGAGDAAFTVRFKTPAALRLPLTELSLGSAYIDGEIDLDGDMFALMDLRDHLRFGASTVEVGKFLTQLFLQAPTAANKAAIDRHYTLGDNFYLSFIDRRFRFYSHCLFDSETQSLDDAAERKLETMWNALGLSAGMRLLDVGGGWGGVTEYCGARGVHVTSLTLVDDSAAYIRALIDEKGVPGAVVQCDVLDFQPSEPFDHAVIYGVIEHIPNYSRLCERMWAALKPGGRLYIDASAVK